jgi:hypothetical protein
MIECLPEVNMPSEVMELTGRVVNGLVVLDQPGKLKDGTEVRVRPVDREPERKGGEGSLSEMLLSFAGTIEGLPEDMARNHDHYLYGVPKKQNDEGSLR